MTVKPSFPVVKVLQLRFKCAETLWCFHHSAGVKFSGDQWSWLLFVFVVWRLAEVWTFTQSVCVWCVHGHGQHEGTKRTTDRGKKWRTTRQTMQSARCRRGVGVREGGEVWPATSDPQTPDPWPRQEDSGHMPVKTVEMRQEAVESGRTDREGEGERRCGLGVN